MAILWRVLADGADRPTCLFLFAWYCCIVSYELYMRRRLTYSVLYLFFIRIYSMLMECWDLSLCEWSLSSALIVFVVCRFDIVGYEYIFSCMVETFGNELIIRQRTMWQFQVRCSYDDYSFSCAKKKFRYTPYSVENTA